MCPCASVCDAGDSPDRSRGRQRWRQGRVPLTTHVHYGDSRPHRWVSCGAGWRGQGVRVGGGCRAGECCHMCVEWVVTSLGVHVCGRANACRSHPPTWNVLDCPGLYTLLNAHTPHHRHIHTVQHDCVVHPHHKPHTHCRCCGVTTPRQRCHGCDMCVSRAVCPPPFVSQGVGDPSVCVGA